MEPLSDSVIGYWATYLENCGLHMGPTHAQIIFNELLFHPEEFVSRVAVYLEKCGLRSPLMHAYALQSRFEWELQSRILEMGSDLNVRCGHA